MSKLLEMKSLFGHSCVEIFFSIFGPYVVLGLWGGCGGRGGPSEIFEAGIAAAHADEKTCK